MAKLETFVCDGCGVTKKDVNHWWRVGTFGQSILIVPLDTKPVHRRYTVKDYCGIGCTQKAVSRRMSETAS